MDEVLWLARVKLEEKMKGRLPDIFVIPSAAGATATALSRACPEVAEGNLFSVCVTATLA
jgi:hypothetical protein